MLTFPTSHALTEALIAAMRSPELTARLPTVLFLHETTDNATTHRIRCHSIRPRHGSGPEGLDTAIVGRLEALTREHTDTQGPIPMVMAAVHATTGDASGFQMLACAVLDDDIVIADDGPHRCRRLDAVDIDGRVYQLTQYPTEAHPVVTVDDVDQPCDTPAAIPALQAALTAAVHLTCRA